MSDLKTVQGIMEVLKVSRSTVYRLIKNEGMPFKKVGGSTRFDVEEVKAWMNSQNKED
ncbi:excisionase and transcriptional regulator [Bacillus phage 000TH010]|uniref:DNA binding domain protein n=1 Tax=Bacillus phage 000TH010 TaxID=2601652 RepID=A0A5P8PI03_9CAUD|nr:excisionase and transcriptional regulator [Bacillus phage 000TH010]QFR56275.1 DNA binding domain protein [Bacillus phage 000TH010]